MFDTLFLIGIFAILSLSVNIEYGFTGLVNFGKVAFYMIGAYAYAILTSTLGLPVWLGFLGAMAVSGAAGLLVSLPSLRLREDYLAIVTLVFGEIMRIILRNVEYANIRGVLGIRNVPRIVPIIPSEPYTIDLGLTKITLDLSSIPYDIGLIVNMVFAFLVFLVFYYLLKRAVNSPFGRVIRGIREDELATQTLGKNTFRYKALVFVLGSAMAGASGSIFAQFFTFVAADQFLPITTFQIWIMSILGGTSNIRGALLGSALVWVLNRGTLILKDSFAYVPLIQLVDPINLQFISTGVLMILFIRFRPSGLLREEPIKTKR